MAIGTGLALLGSAALTAGGSLLASSSNRKAANTARDAEIEAARLNNERQDRIYGQNNAALAPYMTRGNQAGDAIMELLGFMPGQAQAPPNAALGAYG